MAEIISKFEGRAGEASQIRMPKCSVFILTLGSRLALVAEVGLDRGYHLVGQSVSRRAHHEPS